MPTGAAPWAVRRQHQVPQRPVEFSPPTTRGCGERRGGAGSHSPRGTALARSARPSQNPRPSVPGRGLGHDSRPELSAGGIGPGESGRGIGPVSGRAGRSDGRDRRAWSVSPAAP
jgi:hypothetical protein